jgi:hypothetical protein
MKWMALIMLAALSGCADMDRHIYDGLNARQHALGQDGSMSGTPAKSKPDYDEYKRDRDAYLKKNEDSGNDSPAKDGGKSR